MMGLPLIDLVTVFAYFLFVIIVGVWASRRIHSQEDYFLGGRKFGKFIQTFAAFGQSTSVESAVGTTVIVARNGMAGVWQLLTSVLGLPIYWITSVWYRRMRLLTLGDFFEDRYNSRGLAAFYAIVSSVFFMVVIGLGFTAMTKTVTGIAARPYESLSALEKKEYDTAVELEKLESTDVDLLTPVEVERMEQLRLQDPRKEFSYLSEGVIIWAVAIIVIFYAALGGLEAAYITDTVQGIFILILSMLLLPFAFIKITRVFEVSGLSGILHAARAQLPQSAFEIWGSPDMVDFTWYYIASLIVMIQINVAIQANQLTACGSAKDEYTARFGFTTGIYLKRATTLLWGISAMMLVILYGNVIKNPDYLWGHACRDLLAPLGLGLVGLMIACLMAALMSTADMMMITTAGLLTHNLVRPLFPRLDEKLYLHIGRVIGIIAVVGGVLIATQFDTVFNMLKLIWEFNIIMAAAFWMGIRWRRATRAGAWWSMTFALVFFILLQVIIPIFPGVRTNPYLAKTVESIQVERTYTARPVDAVQRRQAIAVWEQLNKIGKAKGERPEPLVPGQEFIKKYNTPKKSIFWSQGIKLAEDGQVTGSGMVSLELVIVDWLGFDLSKNPHALNETIRIILRTTLPFMILILVSYLTLPDDKKRLDRFFVKMKTPVHTDKAEDRKEMNMSYQDPYRFDHKKMFPRSNWEMEKLDRTDIRGILWFTAGGLLILAIVYFIATIGN
ncbi:MAG: sodium:solute symporter family protein [Candidatus Zhuqueibacterota bacterium]